MTFDKIPNYLKKIDRWVCWRTEDRGGKPTKVPINPLTGNRAMSNNPVTWGTFCDAVECVEKRTGLKGIGFMFNGDGVVGVDIDNCRNPESGIIEDFAKDIISTMDSYTETSQSGKGIHILCRGKLPDGKRRKGSVEMYESGRFFVMTGNIIDDAHMDIENRTEELAAVHKKYLSETEKAKTVNNPVETVLNLDENEIIQKAMKAKNGNLFSELYQGSWKGVYGSQSEADMAFCNMLAFWCGRDYTMMDRIFRKSGMYREKWNEKRGACSYGEKTLKEAITSCSEVYTPSFKKAAAPVHNQEDPDIDLGCDNITQAPKDPFSEEISSDLGRSRNFSAKYRNEVIWCSEMKCWLIWNGKHWEADKKLYIVQKAKEMLDEIRTIELNKMKVAKTPEESDWAEKRFKEINRSRNEKPIRAFLELSKSDLAITVGEMDQQPFLMNCMNGVVDLRTGELLNHNPDLKMTKIAEACYEPNKKFKLFGDFLNKITCGDSELVEYFQVVFGMAAIGKVFHEGIIMCVGAGQNGKSTLLNTIGKTLGDYAGSLAPEVLMVCKDGKQPVGLADVRGKRFVTSIETEEGRRISSATLKQLASTDLITSRRLYENNITFEPTHTLILATNFLPKVSSTDVGTWRRIAVVPFRANIKSEKQIKDYASVLHNEDGDAIFSWIVQGAMNFIKNKYHITLPRTVHEATLEYRTAEDWLNNFISEYCEVGDFEEAAGKLYDSYVLWCERNNDYKRRPRDFAAALESAGYDKRRTKNGILWRGIKLIKSKAAHVSIQESILDDDEIDKYTRERM